jgi:hypothetical protein
MCTFFRKCKYPPKNIKNQHSDDCGLNSPHLDNLHKQNYSSISQTYSFHRYRGFTKRFPSVTVSRNSSYSVLLISSFLQNLMYPFFLSLSGSLFGSLPLCSSLPGYFGVSLNPHPYNVPRPSQLCQF